MKNKKQFTLIELIIVIVVIGILAAMALPKFNGVVRDAKLSAMINDKEVLEKALVMYYQKNDELPLLNEDEELIIANKGISISKIVLAEEVESSDMDTIYKSLKETLTYYNDSEETLYRIDLSKLKDNLSKDIKYGHKKNDKDFYVYSTNTGNVYYYDFVVNGNGTIQHTEYDTLLKDNELVKKMASHNINNPSNDDFVFAKNNILSISSWHTLKIENGNLYAWGNNEYGQLGIGNQLSQTTPQLVTLPNNEKPISVKTGVWHSMVITEEGNLYTWGLNKYGQLGIGNATSEFTPQLVTIPNGEKVISVYSKNASSMVITDKGNLYAWGYNAYWQLGLENNINQTTPQLVTLPNEEKAVSVSLGVHNVIVLTNKENLYVCGWNQYGQLGIGNKTHQATFQLLTLPNNEKPLSVELGDYHSAIITKSKNIYTFGINTQGQLGLGDTIEHLTPQLVTLPNNEKPLSISLGYNNSAIITNKGNLYVCGSNNYGQLGTGNTISQLTPQKVTLPNNEKTMFISLGDSVSMAITNKGNLYTWGFNQYGQLGIGNLENQLIPQLVTFN